MKYSVGQKVITHRFDKMKPVDLSFIDSVGRITTINEVFKQYLVHGWWWPEEALELVESETLDLTKILRVGDKIYSAMQGDVEVASLQDDIRCKDVKGNIYRYYKDGCRLTTGECVLFPSRDNRDWSTFKRKPDLKRGDIVKVWDDDGIFFVRVFSHYENGGRLPFKTFNGDGGKMAWQHAEKISIDELKDFE